MKKKSKAAKFCEYADDYTVIEAFYPIMLGDFLPIATDLTIQGATLLIAVRLGTDGVTPEDVQMDPIILPLGLSRTQRKAMIKEMEAAAYGYVSSFMEPQYGYEKSNDQPDGKSVSTEIGCSDG